MSDFFAKNLQMLLDKSGMSVYDLGPRIDADPSTIYRWLNPTIGSIPRSRTRLAIASVFDVDPSEMLYRDLTEASADGASAKKNPNTSYMSCDKNSIPLVEAKQNLRLASAFDTDFSLEPGKLIPNAIDWIPGVPDRKLQRKRLAALVAKGNAMAPTICNGDVVYVEFEFGDKRLPHSEGEIVLMEYEENNGVSVGFRELAFGDSEEDRWGRATNPDWPKERMAKAQFIFGKVVAIFRKL